MNYLYYIIENKMLNRRRKNQLMDPKRVVTYNKFLSTLDQIPITVPDLS